VLTSDMFGGAFAFKCLDINEYCSINASTYLDKESCPTEWIIDASEQPDYLTYPIKQRNCGSAACSEG
jgi:hypothetical protein